MGGVALRHRDSYWRKAELFALEPSNILKIKSLTSDWYDKDMVMLHACFQLLEDCVEQENLLDGFTDWDQTEEFQEAYKDLKELYEWWQIRKQLITMEKYDELEEENYDEDTRRLQQLIRWRHMLWT